MPDRNARKLHRKLASVVTVVAGMERHTEIPTPVRQKRFALSQPLVSMGESSAEGKPGPGPKVAPKCVKNRPELNARSIAKPRVTQRTPRFVDFSLHYP